MGTTTNNGWPTPVATDLVKDGWEAIKDLGDAIDTTLGVYVPSTSGLTLINTTSFSGVASQSFNDVFSSTYDSYRIVATGTITSTRVAFRLRVSGTDATGSNYETGFIGTGGEGSGTNTAFLPMADAGGDWWITFDLLRPFLTEATTMISFGGNTTNKFRFGANRHNLSTSYTGLTILPEGAGNTSGTLSIYGYSK